MAYRKEMTYSCAKNWNVSDSSMNSPRYVRWGESNKIPELRIEPGWTLLVMEGGKKNWYWWRNDTGWVERRTVTGVSTLLKIDNEISNRSSNHKNQRRVKNWQCYSDEEESGGQSATEPAEALPETGMAVNRNCVNREFHRFCPDFIKGMSAQRIDRRVYVGTVSSSSENPLWNCFHANGDCKTFERRTKARLREFSTRNVGSFLKVADLAVISWNARWNDEVDMRPLMYSSFFVNT
ncbi:hypothetical protein R1flu_024938 [Riccia fluitans]|uniref:Uncharacterized protein n=1 Tax=Riccia fluitans TaxID=41844 RepID=A0ABD1XZB3_9MARC